MVRIEDNLVQILLQYTRLIDASLSSMPSMYAARFNSSKYCSICSEDAKPNQEEIASR